MLSYGIPKIIEIYFLFQETNLKAQHDILDLIKTKQTLIKSENPIIDKDQQVESQNTEIEVQQNQNPKKQTESVKSINTLAIIQNVDEINQVMKGFYQQFDEKETLHKLALQQLKESQEEEKIKLQSEIKSQKQQLKDQLLKNSVRDAFNQQCPQQQSNKNENSQPRVKSLIPKPTSASSQKQSQSNLNMPFPQSKTFDNSCTPFNNQKHISQQSNNLLFSQPNRLSQGSNSGVQQQQSKSLSSQRVQQANTNKNHYLQMSPDTHHNSKHQSSQHLSKIRQQYSQTLLPTQMLSHQQQPLNLNSSNIIVGNDQQQQTLGQMRASDLSTNCLSINDNNNFDHNIMPLQIGNNHNSFQPNYTPIAQKQQVLNSNPQQQVRCLKQPTHFNYNNKPIVNSNNTLSNNQAQNRNSLISGGEVQDRHSNVSNSQLQNQYGIKLASGQSRVNSANNLKQNAQSHQVYQQKLQSTNQDLKQQTKRPQSSNNVSSSQQQIQQHQTTKFSKIGHQINTVLQTLEPPKSTISNTSEQQLPKPHPSQQNYQQNINQQNHTQSHQVNEQQYFSNSSQKMNSINKALDIPLQLNRLQNSIVNNQVTSKQQENFLSNRTSCYDREEMDEKYLENADVDQSQCYKIVHQGNQQNMLQEITNLLKGSQSRMAKQSQLGSGHSNDYSITQFNMNTIITTPYNNETLSNINQIAHNSGTNQRPPSTSQIIPSEISASNTTNTTYIGMQPLKQQNQFNNKLITQSVSVGEENIQNDESPHKCHSIKTYHISTFFNNGGQQQMKFLSYLSQQSQNIATLSSRQYQQINPQTFNYDYLRTYPKMNFQLPEQKTHENISVSQYETPINQSIPMITINGPIGGLIGDHTLNQQDMSILTNSCLNTSQPPEIVSIYGMNGGDNAADFGQNNQKRLQTFNKNQILSDQSNITLNNTTLNLTQPEIQIHKTNLNNPKNLSQTQPIQLQQINQQAQGQHIKIQNCYSVSDNNNNNMSNIDLSSNQDVQNDTELVSSRQNTQNVEIHRQHLIQTFNALQTIPLLGPYQKSYLRKERIYLPPPRDPSLKKLLILDIDETMIHCLDERDPEHEEPDIVIRIPLDDEGDYADAGINIRAHLHECLRQYANAILDYIDPDKSLIQYRLYRQHCIETEFGFIKDLRVIANRDLKDMVLVDNSVLSFAMQIENGIPILPFYTSKADEELLHLVYYLKCLVVQDDVRCHNKEAFGLTKLAQMDLQQIMKSSNNTYGGCGDSVGSMGDDYQDDNESLGEGLDDDSSSSLGGGVGNNVADNYSDSLDGGQVMMSPNTKINNVKQKYQPYEMDLINEDSMESDLTSSIMSKRLIGIQSKKQKQQNQQKQQQKQRQQQQQQTNSSNKTNTSLQNISNSNLVNSSFSQKPGHNIANNQNKQQQPNGNNYQQLQNNNSLNSQVTTSSNAFENYLVESF
eukprot:403336778